MTEDLGMSGPTLDKPMLHCPECRGVFIAGIHECKGAALVREAADSPLGCAPASPLHG